MKKLLFFLLVVISIESHGQAFSGSISCSPSNCIISCINPTVSLLFMPIPFSATFSIVGWSNGATTNPATYSMGGVATITVTNGSNNYSFNKVVNLNTSPPSFTLSAIHPTCAACCNGQLNVSFASNRTYSLNGVSQGSSNSYSNLCNGKQFVCVQDNSSGCTKCDSLLLDYTSGIIENNSAEQFRFFPNPASTSLKLLIPYEIKNGQLILFNIRGEKVYEQAVISGLNNLNTMGLTKGLYNYFLLTDNRKKIYGKLIIE